VSTVLFATLLLADHVVLVVVKNSGLKK